MGSHPTKVTITFEQDFAPPVFKVDERLAEVGWFVGWFVGGGAGGSSCGRCAGMKQSWRELQVAPAGLRLAGPPNWPWQAGR